jgi:hypothetical protein
MGVFKCGGVVVVVFVVIDKERNPLRPHTTSNVFNGQIKYLI